MISKYSTKKKEASLFLEHILSEESQKTMYEIGRYLPILDTIYQDSSYMREHPSLAFLRGLMEIGIHRPAHPDYTKVSDVLARYLNMGLKAEMSVDEALEKAVSMVQSLDIPVR